MSYRLGFANPEVGLVVPYTYYITRNQFVNKRAVLSGSLPMC